MVVSILTSRSDAPGIEQLGLSQIGAKQSHSPLRAPQSFSLLGYPDSARHDP